MTITTSYLAVDGNNPNALLIANGVPKWYTGRCCKLLAPDWDDVKRHKETGDTILFTKHYLAKLDKLGIDKVLSVLTDGDVLLCYEKPGDFCHRHILASWLREHGVTIEREG